VIELRVIEAAAVYWASPVWQSMMRDLSTNRTSMQLQKCKHVLSFRLHVFLCKRVLVAAGAQPSVTVLRLLYSV
jgi:hypothetical protein